MSTTTRRGFTLIELMISVTLGMIIVYVAVAGFRTASQSITITNRLAMETAILRAGCLAGNERLDFWYDFDDPEDEPTARRLYYQPGKLGGLPFSPMDEVFELKPNKAEPEKQTGWDRQEPWKAADSRTWWHGNLAEKVGSEMALGRYSIFSNSSPGSVMVTGGGGVGAYGAVTAPHQWYNRQMWGLQNALGFYGFTDYMPPNTLYACYQEYQSVAVPPFYGTNDDGMPLLLFKPSSGEHYMFYNGEGSGIIPGLWRLTMGTSYGVVSPTSANANFASAHRSKYRVGYWLDQGDTQRFMNETVNNKSLLAGPSHWPIAEVATQHFIKCARYVNLCQVRLRNPITGYSSELAFTSFSTTLRGARLQRRHPSENGGKGWAVFDNAAGFDNDLTLDDTSK
jgi:prepilin-type N-terminal cleavage/methylation domain-containing protein